MATFDASAFLGDRAIRATEAQLETIRNQDPGLYRAGLENLIRHLHYFTIDLSTATANSNTKKSVAYVARMPFKVVGVEHGCLSAASTTATSGLEKAPAATPTIFATMQSSLTDIKTAAPVAQAGAILDGAEDFAVGDVLRLSVVSGSAANVVGSNSIVHCFRL